MLYNKNDTPKLDIRLFENPTSEYRGTPFWAWNCELNKDLLLRQIDYLKEMGFGGFHMHSRSGMATTYLSEEFMELVKICRDKAEKENMLTWLYDEDRYPSGFAGGYVTKNPEHRQKMLRLTGVKPETVSFEEGVKTGKAYLVGVFDVLLDRNGFMTDYKKIDENDSAKGLKRYAYVETAATNGWWNGTSYVDVLSSEATKEFIDITYKAYEKAVGESFGKSIPSIFTDEPATARKWPLKSPEHENEDKGSYVPWTTDLNDTFFKEYGEELVDKIPELFWDFADGTVSLVRYRFHDHVCQRFVDAFLKPCGKWCDEHGIYFTGHLVAEPTLSSQCGQSGEAMRCYEPFGIPGIDMLRNYIELTTAKQAQSVKNQFGRCAMLSEMYGVTNWDFDFKSHKFQGDWQAALGVTVRVPHLSWVSMKGSAKRDYPASINYQSAWYKDYKYVEDHFSRLNTVLTRGKPEVNVAVIHPIESYWLHTGPAKTSGNFTKKLDENFKNITEWLLHGTIDFDFISESLLPSQYKKSEKLLTVGEMKYKTVIVPNCETLRSTTLEILKEFRNSGGRVIFAGECPSHLDAVKSDEILSFYNICEHIPFEKHSILDALNEERICTILTEEEIPHSGYVHCVRNDGDVKWLFIAPCKYENNKYIQDTDAPKKTTVIVKGTYNVRLFDTLNGKISSVPFETKNKNTYIHLNAASFDSFLFELTEGEGSFVQEKSPYSVIKAVDFKTKIPYTRTEENVYVLDMAEYKLDDDNWQEKEELSRIDTKCRALLNFPAADGRDVQPWVIGKEQPKHHVTFKFIVPSSFETDVSFAAEEVVSLKLNGKSIDLIPNGYYTDECIIKYPIGSLKKGENTLEVVVPIGKRISLENCFLVGDFDVKVFGCNAKICPPSNEIHFGNTVYQGMPFYGGNIKYNAEFELPEDTDINVRVSRHRGAAVKIHIDSEEAGYIVCPPYCTTIRNLKKGKHKICFELLGNRVNTFSALHNTEDTSQVAPQHWYTKNQKWSYEYVLKESGILASPVIEILKKE